MTLLESTNSIINLSYNPNARKPALSADSTPPPHVSDNQLIAALLPIDGQFVRFVRLDGISNIFHSFSVKNSERTDAYTITRTAVDRTCLRCIDCYYFVIFLNLTNTYNKKTEIVDSREVET